MVQSAAERIGQYVKEYNAAIAAGNTEGAICYGELAVRDAQDALKLNDGSPQAAYYTNVINKISPFLANPHKRGGGTLDKGGEKEKRQKVAFSFERPKQTFDDIAGCRDVVEQMFLKVIAPNHPGFSSICRKYQGATNKINLLLYGPPGTGKTFFMRCLAGELGCAYFPIKLSDVMRKYVGEGSGFITEVFAEAKRVMREEGVDVLIFFDEVDAIASSREGDDSKHTKDLLTTLLTEMDGFGADEVPGRVRIVAAATNRPWALDSAVKRGGRFDTQIYVPLPDTEARKKLIRVALGKEGGDSERDVPFDPELSVDWIADRLVGYAGADIKAICSQAVLKPMMREIVAARRGSPREDALTRADFDEVLSGYINSITVESLAEFDAYGSNMSYDDEYKGRKCEELLLRLYNDKAIQAWESEWLRGMLRGGKIAESIAERYDLSFLKSKIGE